MNVQYLKKIVAQNVALMEKKNSDYSRNSGDNIVRTGVYGVAVRLTDKIERLLSLTDPSNKDAPNFESITDTLRDISNYGLIGLMLEAGQWKEPYTKEDPDFTSTSEQLYGYADGKKPKKKPRKR